MFHYASLFRLASFVVGSCDPVMSCPTSVGTPGPDGSSSWTDRFGFWLETEREETVPALFMAPVMAHR